MYILQAALFSSLILGLASTVCTTDYDVRVKTGSSFGAGTNARVYIKLFGTRATTAEHELVGSGNPFERGSIDVFVIKDNTVIGDLVAIQLRRDESGWMPNWQLVRVGVRSRISGRWSMFDYNDWTRPNVWFTISVTCDPGYTKNSQTGTCDWPICGSKPSQVSSRILGGTQAFPGSWPWQAILEFKRGHSRFCSGTLILPQWVLTTAYCVYGKQASMLGVRLGAAHLTNKAASEQYMDVSDVFIHPDYHKYTIFSHDIALVKLARPARLTDEVKLACPPKHTIALPVNDPSKMCWYTGWSRESGALFQAPVPLVPESNCKSATQKMHSSMLCGYEARNDTGPCVKDRGGPLSCEAQGKWYLEGLISTGTGCHVPTPKKLIFSKLRYLEDWVMNTINDNHDF